MEELRKIIIEQYGLKRGGQIIMNVLPNIVEDFKKTLRNSLIGLELKEEYRFDDKSGSIWLFGVKKSDGKCSVIKANVNGYLVENIDI